MCQFAFVKVSGESKSFNSVKEFMATSDDGMYNEFFGTKLPVRFTSYKKLMVRIEAQIETCSRWLDNLKKYQATIALEEAESNESAIQAYIKSLSPEKRKALLGE